MRSLRHKIGFQLIECSMLEDWKIFSTKTQCTQPEKNIWVRIRFFMFKIKLELEEGEMFQGGRSNFWIPHEMFDAFRAAYEFTDLTSHVSATHELNAFSRISFKNSHLFPNPTRHNVAE